MAAGSQHVPMPAPDREEAGAPPNKTVVHSVAPIVSPVATTVPAVALAVPPVAPIIPPVVLTVPPVAPIIPSVVLVVPPIAPVIPAVAPAVPPIAQIIPAVAPAVPPVEPVASVIPAIAPSVHPVAQVIPAVAPAVPAAASAAPTAVRHGAATVISPPTVTKRDGASLSDTAPSVPSLVESLISAFRSAKTDEERRKAASVIRSSPEALRAINEVGGELWKSEQRKFANLQLARQSSQGRGY